MNPNDLPESVQAELGGQDKAAHVARLDEVGRMLADKRSAAIDARRASGIEEVWRKCEEAYLGIDEANRGEFAGARQSKPTSLEGPLQSNANRQTMSEGARSTIFVRLTSRYVDAGAAKLGEILLPMDDKAFSFSPTPVPELVDGAKDLTQVKLPGGIPAERDPQPHELEPGAAPAEAPGKPLTVKDIAEEQMKMAEAAAKKAEQRIFDWMVESRYPAQMRKVIFDMARIGVGVVKSPYPDERRSMAARRVASGVQVDVVRKIQPSTKWVDPWNVYPDPACGEDIQEGDFVFERDGISERRLRKLRGMPGYLPDQIDEVLREGPGRCYIDDQGRPVAVETVRRTQYDIWYFTGSLSGEDMATALGDPADAAKYLGRTIYAVVTMVNDRVIRAAFNPLDHTGDHPYHAAPWQRRPEHWAGVGVGEQLSAPQRITNASTRAMLNNAGVSAGGQIVLDQGCITPVDGSWTIYPNKLWYKAPDAATDDVNKAFAVFQFPSVTAQMMTIIEFGFRLAEEATSIPLISQGHSGPSTPDTYGAAQLQNNNANQLLRNVGYQFDDYITEPVVRQHYEWLLLDPDVPDDEKGDFDIHAHGSIALVERAIQDQTILQLGAMVMNPAFGMSPPRWFEQMLKSKRLDPRDFEMTEDEKARRDAQPAPEAPAVVVAKIREEGANKRAELDTDRDTAYVQAETERNLAVIEARNRELELKLRLAVMEHAEKRNLGLDQIKADLAEAAAKIDLQRELGRLSNQVIKPPVEPRGRAPKGQAFQK